MPRKPFQKGNKLGKGRPKGSKNKFTTVHQAFVDAFQELGGADWVVKVAKQKRTQGHALAAMTKLLPTCTELSGPGGGPIQANISVKVNLVKPSGNNNT